MKKHKAVPILLSVVLLSLAVTCVDLFLKPAYLPKILVKILAFLLIPTLYFARNRAESENFRNLFRFRGKTMLTALLVGLGIYGAILGGFFALRGVIDFSNVAGTLLENHGITAENFVWVSLYISLMNSFLEEFFFRGFGFIAFKPHTGRTFAYLFSPAMFALYHAGMLVGMFARPVLLLIFAGLFAGGCIFNRLNETSGNIYTSWASHAFANFAINTIGFLLLGIV